MLQIKHIGRRTKPSAQSQPPYELHLPYPPQPSFYFDGLPTEEDRLKEGCSYNSGFCASAA